MERRDFMTKTAIAGGIAATAMTMSQKAEALEQAMSAQLDRAQRAAAATERNIGLPWMCDVAGRAAEIRGEKGGEMPGASLSMMGDDPRLPKMPTAPTLMDFFRLRFAPASHLLQSANLALKNGHSETVIMACLLHDIAMSGLLRTDHGYWGAQLVEPYVDEEVSWSIRAHQSLRFFADPEVGYEYPKSYIRLFGEDYRPEPYVVADYERARKHKWYMTARLITMNDLYAFDPNAKVSLDTFTDIIGRNFRQPKDGLGFDGSPVAHMWRTIIWPNNFL
ncbi:MAG: twin-arginine translocation signal domain-containing protein [Rhodospirillaceae bacterium]|nr:twin-arginine translocation signal domain-containing protein [Rhodospirillaceae bacterium]